MRRVYADNGEIVVRVEIVLIKTSVLTIHHVLFVSVD